jgi:hypothetical protein
VCTLGQGKRLPLGSLQAAHGLVVMFAMPTIPITRPGAAGSWKKRHAAPGWAGLVVGVCGRVLV